MSGRSTAIAIGLALIALSAACGSLLDLDGLESGASAGPDGGGTPSDTADGAPSGADGASIDGSRDGAPPGSGCLRAHGPVMVKIAGVETFCIDSTEVTKAQYKEFLLFLDQTAGDAGAFAPSDVCSWNSTFVPDDLDWPPHNEEELEHPVNSINWCAAATYCLWAGKHLCRGSKPGTLDPSQAYTTNAHWFRACTEDGKRTYPYGDAFKDVCNTSITTHPQKVLPVGSMTGCEGGYPGLVDMSGNVAEWIDACDENASSARGDECTVQGGAFDSSEDYAKCSDTHKLWRFIATTSIGFRCCAEPL